jgi:hypothetical protein
MRWRILGALVAVLATGWLLAGAAAATFARPASVSYPADLGAASWIQAPGGAPNAYFRLPLPLTHTPVLATLWIDADQQYLVYANGADVAIRRSSTATGQPPLVDPVDLSGRLHQGLNGIGVEIINADGGPAAFRARLTLEFDNGKQETYVTSPGTWLAARSAAQVYYPGSNTKSASFSMASFDASQWAYAARASTPHPADVSLMPPAVVAGPLTGQVISAGTSPDMVASSTIAVPPRVSDAWVRVIASDSYTLSVDGRVVANQPAIQFVAGRGRRPQASVGIYDIRPFLRAGDDSLQVHVYGSGPAAVYMDGVVDSASGRVGIATGPTWQTATTQEPDGGAVPLGPVGRYWRTGVRRTGVVPGNVVTGGTDYVPIGMAIAVGLWLATGALSARAGRHLFGRALLTDAAGHLPALAATAAVLTIARLPSWIPPWPYVPAVFWLLVATLLAGKLTALAGSAESLPGLPAPLARLPRPAWLSRLARLARSPRLQPRLQPRFQPRRVARRVTAALARRTAARLATWAASVVRLASPPRLAVAAAAARTGRPSADVDSGPAWRPAARPDNRPDRLTLLPDSARRLLSRFTWADRCVIVIALAGTGQLCYGLGYEPYSGDETVSLLAAQSIRAHLLPQFPSGLLYLKGELYEYLLAAYTAVVGEGPVQDRLLTVLTYGATVLAFGLLLLPIVLRGRHRVTQVLVTLLFATAPMELQEAQLVRMYQQEQLFAIAFVSFFLLALRSSRSAEGTADTQPSGRLWELATRWSIPLSAITLVCMYLSLEESFILLPAIPVALFGGLRLRWLRDRRWLKWGLPAAAIIGIQYVLTIVTKMPSLGFDQSNKPYIYYDPSNFYYYLAHYLLAIPGGSGGVAAGSGNGTLYLVTSLAVVAGVVAVARRDFDRLYLSAFCWIPVLVLSTMFSAYAERYLLIVLPALFALAGFGALDILRWLRAVFTTTEDAPGRRLIAGLVAAAVVPGFVWLGASQPARPQDYGLALSRLTGVPYAPQQADYATVTAYMKAHERPGDLFITLASTTDAAYYAGRAPDMVIQPHPDKLLYLTEKNGIVIEVYYGSRVILTAADLEQVIASHPRIWLLTDQGHYFSSVSTDITQLIRAQFTEVAAGVSTALYFKGD